MSGLPLAVELRAEGRKDPLGLDELRPRLSWRVQLEEPAIQQASFAIQVSADARFANTAMTWSRASVAGDESAIVYDGPPPGSRERRYWRVRLVDDRGTSGPWSRPGSWEMGLLSEDDWAARWIAWIDPSGSSWSSRSPILRRSFRLSRAVSQARAYVSALGLVELLINGRPVGEDLLAPGWTDYRRRIQYRTLDVGDLLRTGENVVAARLGRGWFAGDVGQFGAEQYGDYPALLVQLEIDLVGGRRLVIATDASWRAHPGPLGADDLVMGESFDARDEPAGWNAPGFRDDDWQPVIFAAGPGGRLVAQRDSGVGVVAELEPGRITSLGDGRQVVDFGQNIAGHVRIRAAQNAGTTIAVRHAEALDSRGELWTANLRTARQTDAFTFRGDDAEVFEPRFTYHGFRYVEIGGLSTRLEPSQVTARAVSSMRRTIGAFSCSDELVNSVHRNVVWGLRGGIVGIPHDCPQRDERLGWTADVAAMAPSALFLGDTAAVFEKWLIDLADAQLPSGAYSDIAPRIGVTGAGNTGWADAGLQLPWSIYQQTGDVGVIERQYDSMLRFVRFLEADNVGGLRHGGRYGDWLALEEPTSLELLGTAYLAYSAQLFGRIARLLGHEVDARAADRLAAGATACFRQRFTTPSGMLVRETQTGYALALAFGLLPRRARSVAAGRLAALITDADDHLLTGFLGTGPVLPALSDHGHHELATRLVRQDTFPSWGYEVRQGATTIWERWNSWTPEEGFADPGMNSLNHAALGSVAAWLHEYLAGLAPGAPGYRTMLVRPRPAAGIEWAQATHESPHGTHGVAWQADKRALEVTLDVPPNTFADVVIPAPVRSVRVDGARAGSGAHGVLRVASSRAERRLTLSWGHHVVTVER